MNSLKLDRKALEQARRQFCLDIGLPWEEYRENFGQKIFIRKAAYRERTCQIDSAGARIYEGRNDFFHAMICLGQLFLVVDEQIYDWAVEKFADCAPEWFCEFENLRMIDHKLKEYGHRIKDTHVYMLPEAEDGRPQKLASRFVWYDREEILNFQENNQFTSAICFSKTQPDMLAVVAPEQTGEKPFDQSQMAGMAGVSADGEYLWQIGINVVRSSEGKGLAARLVRLMKEEVIRQGKTPFYGTSESHTISQTVGLKAGFVPAWTEVYVE